MTLILSRQQNRGYEFNKISLIVGLGNPGKQYMDTRHNAGWWFLERLADKFQFALKPEPKFSADFGAFTLDQSVVRVIAPTTFMNRCGRSVRSCAAYFKIDSSQILVIHDELDFSPGISRLKVGGGHGGHNGLQDIGNSLGTFDFARLRIGIGHPQASRLATKYVLSKPTSSEMLRINQSMNNAMQAMQLLLAGHLEQAMQQLHTKDLTYS